MGCLHASFELGCPFCEATVRALEQGRAREVLEQVDHPPHYRAGGIEAIDVIEAFGLGFRLGNAIKYILRAGRKGATVEDLKKARWYLDREIEKAGT